MIDILRHLRPSLLGAQLSEQLTRLFSLVLPPDSVQHVVQAVRLKELLAGSINTCVFVSALLALFWSLEYFTGTQRSIYRSKVFIQDVVYALFYHGGFFTILIWAGVANALDSGLGILKIGVLAAWPAPVHWALYWIMGDFIHYWVHRLEHAWAPLWAIHSVHHSQEEMTFISTYRFHPLEQLLQNLVMVVPLLIIGVPTVSWLPLTVGLTLFDAAQHSALDWTYGRGYRVLVSPRFHALHHSTDPRQYNGNYSKILSVWDYLFGTAIQDARPVRIGVDGLPVPRTIGAQLLAPFRMLSGRSRT